MEFPFRRSILRHQTLLVLLVLAVGLASCRSQEANWQATADSVTIIRDNWGVPHIYGKTDADAVFGLMYAQAEDDFNRVETNFINAMGRLAEAEGESAIWRDLRMKLFIDPAELQELYDDSPRWLRNLMDAWAAGLNYYLETHPEVTPRVITRFEPWMALSFSEGSIGGDIERVSLRQLEQFYGGDPVGLIQEQREAASREAEPALLADRGPLADVLFTPDSVYEEPQGSNGFAIAPSNSASGHALLWINPHTSFFFRAEAQVVSEEGLNAYGALTWGQFFVYQGFNEKAGWMHTSSGVDNIDEYLETVVERNGELFYVFGDEERAVESRQVSVPYRTENGMAERVFTVYRTHHGPVVRSEAGQWVSVSLMESPREALIQSYTRTKATNLAEYKKNMEGHTNSSNNTVYADADGNIAYFHSNFIPRRDPAFNWDEPVDGSNPDTDWKGVLSLEESPNMFNPSTGWIQNTNNWPYSVSGQVSPKIEDFPGYVERGTENPRGVNAVRVLSGKTDFTLESLISAGYDTYLSAFADMVPFLVEAWDRAPRGPRKASLASQIQILREWNFRWAVDSVPTTLAVYWGEEVRDPLAAAARQSQLSSVAIMVTDVGRAVMLDALTRATAKLEEDFGTWRKPWGEVNRFQRLTGDIVQPFNDDAPSIPVGFTSSRWGSLASFGARSYPGTVKRYGTSGNSFVAAVEFGDSLRAVAITAGGLNSDPDSPHFNDQAQRYADGNLRQVHFYREQVEANKEREYHPGQR